MADDDKLDDVYAQAKALGAQAIYDPWAKDYDAQTAGAGFRLPALAAGFVARYVPAGDTPILDAAAGTGQVGRCLAVLGYGNLTGIDISAPMLEVAERSGAYRSCWRHDLADPLPGDNAEYSATLCIGAFGPGHAPPECLGELARVTRPGGHVIFNVVEAHWQDQGFPEIIARLVDQGLWQEVEQSDGFSVYTQGHEDVLARLFVMRRL